MAIADQNLVRLANKIVLAQCWGTLTRVSWRFHGLDITQVNHGSMSGDETNKIVAHRTSRYWLKKVVTIKPLAMSCCVFFEAADLHNLRFMKEKHVHRNGRLCCNLGPCVLLMQMFVSNLLRCMNFAGFVVCCYKSYKSSRPCKNLSTNAKNEDQFGIQGSKMIED